MNFDLKNNNEVIIEITNDDMFKINNIIKKYSDEVNKKIIEIRELELANLDKYSYNKNKEIVLKHRKLVDSVIRNLLNLYKEELVNLEIVFLGCSFGRQTNKIESDLDLHFVYKDNKYNYKYEEILCYLISKLLNKKRDDIDPKFVINFDLKLKKETELLMNKNDLIIILKNSDKEIKYSYNSKKKKKFFLQYMNNKTIDDYKKYIIENGIVNINHPWAHSYDVIYGEDKFNDMYNEIVQYENKILNDNYFRIQIDMYLNELINYNLNIYDEDISLIKKNYQTNVFTLFYKFLNIIRLFYIKNGYCIKYLEIYNLYELVSLEHRSIIDDILKYIWIIRNFSIYCNLNSINYSIHVNEKLKDYDLNKYNDMYVEIRNKILIILNEMREKYE